MKKLSKFQISLILFLGMFSLTSCDKNEDSDIIMSDKSAAIQLSKKLSNIEKSENITYIYLDDWDTEFDDFADEFFQDNPQGLIDIEYIVATQQYKIITQDIGPYGQDPYSAEKIICRGTDKGTVDKCAARFKYANDCIPAQSHQPCCNGGTIYRAYSCD